MAYQELPSPPATAALRAACRDAVHVVLPDGRVLRAGHGCVVVLREIGWWWLAPLLWPPLLWGVEQGYRLVAGNRRFFARFLFRRE